MAKVLNTSATNYTLQELIKARGVCDLSGLLLARLIRLFRDPFQSLLKGHPCAHRSTYNDGQVAEHEHQSHELLHHRITNDRSS